MNRATVNIDPSANLARIKSIHVVKFAPDGRSIDQMISRRLVAMGYQATTGDTIPPEVDAVITYEDKWTWDINLYMVQLTISIRDKDSGFPLATANSMHGS